MYGALRPKTLFHWFCSIEARKKETAFRWIWNVIDCSVKRSNSDESEFVSVTTKGNELAQNAQSTSNAPNFTGKIEVKIIVWIVMMICVRSNDQHRSTNKPGLKHTHFVLWMKCLPTESATPPTTLWSLFTTFFSLFFFLRRSFSLSPRHSFALSYTLCLSGCSQCAVQTIYDWTGQTHFVALWFLSIALCLSIRKHFTQTSAMHSTRTHISAGCIMCAEVMSNFTLRSLRSLWAHHSNDITILSCFFLNPWQRTAICYLRDGCRERLQRLWRVWQINWRECRGSAQPWQLPDDSRVSTVVNWNNFTFFIAIRCDFQWILKAYFIPIRRKRQSRERI